MNKIKNFFMRIAIKCVVFFSKDGNYVKHAKKEFDIAWKDRDPMQEMMCNQIIELLSVLSTQGDSGTSIGYKLNLFNKLVNFSIISPLTFKDNEFANPFSIEGSRQNIRDGRVFMDKDGSFSFNDAIVFHDKYYIGDNDNVIERDGGVWYGGTFVVTENGEIYYIGRGKIKDINNFYLKTITVESYSIEYPNGWWLRLCKESDLKEYFDKYLVEKNYTKFENEVGFKDGLYKESIIQKVKAMTKKMYGDSFKLEL